MGFGPKGLERRRAERVALDLPGAPVSVVGARMLNASPLGMMIESPVRLETEAELPLRLVVRGAKTDVVARVAGCVPLAGARRAYGVGLEFTHIDEAARESLRAVLESIREGHEPGRAEEKRGPRPRA
jgi:Tfp pilus assembly protein PilZ